VIDRSAPVLVHAWLALIERLFLEGIEVSPLSRVSLAFDFGDLDMLMVGWTTRETASGSGCAHSAHGGYESMRGAQRFSQFSPPA
jgi:hypothetical protein